MIFITLSDGTITKRMVKGRNVKRNEGYTYNGIFYSSDLIKVPSFELSAKDGGLTQTGQGQFSVEVLASETGYDSVVDFSSKDLSVTVDIWDEQNGTTAFTVFSGRAYLGAMTRDEYTYRLKSEKGELANDLLVPAPDIRQNAYLDADKSFYFTTVDQGGNWSNTYDNNRLFPMRLGIIKHCQMFKLAENAPVSVPSDSVGEYYADGSVYALYDNGLKIKYAQYSGDYRVLKNKAASKPVYEITMDIDGEDTAVKTDSVAKDVLPLTWVFRQSSEPLSTVYVLKEGMTWYDTDNNDFVYRYDGSSWVDATTTVTNDKSALILKTLPSITSDGQSTKLYHEKYATATPSPTSGGRVSTTSGAIDFGIYPYNDSTSSQDFFRFYDDGLIGSTFTAYAYFHNSYPLSHHYEDDIGIIFYKIAEVSTGTSNFVIKVKVGTTTIITETAMTLDYLTSFYSSIYLRGMYFTSKSNVLYMGGYIHAENISGTGPLSIEISRVTPTDEIIIFGGMIKSHNLNALV